MVAAELINREPDAGAIAATAIALWQHIDATLSPVLGRRGVCALFQRSLKLVSDEFPEFASLDLQNPPKEYASLEPVFKQFDAPRASAAHIALIQTFHRLLVELIGVSLAEQLVASNPEYARVVKGSPNA